MDGLKQMIFKNKFVLYLESYFRELVFQLAFLRYSGEHHIVGLTDMAYQKPSNAQLY